MEIRQARLSVVGLLALLLASSARAQQIGPPGGGVSPADATPMPSDQPLRMVYGRVILENGQPVPELVDVQFKCGTRVVQVTQPDLKGNFELVVEGGLPSDPEAGPSSEISLSAEAGTTDSHDRLAVIPGSARRLFGCELQISVPGYRPITKTIPDMGGTQRFDVGDLILARRADVPGSAISVVSLHAPKNARKEFERGEREVQKKRLETAAQYFERAVTEYDQYAAAWNELGQIYAIGHQIEKARQAFEKAISADPKYVPPYVSLAALELQDKQYERAAAMAGKAVELYPADVLASFIQAAAEFRLNRMDAAEKSARDVEKEPHLNIPQVHVLLADILVRKQDYSGAADQLRTYLKEAPQGQFAAETKLRLERLELTGGHGSIAPPRPSTLEVSLRMQDESPFVGWAHVRLFPAEGDEMSGAPAGTAGDVMFTAVPPGMYAVEASAPGFETIRVRTQLEPGNDAPTLILTMKPKPAAASVDPLVLPPVEQTMIHGRPSWFPPDVDGVVPNVQLGVACPSSRVLASAGQRINELVEDLQKFSATEHVEHFSVNGEGSRGKAETRTFDYVVILAWSQSGFFKLDEYRNGSVDPSLFPSGVGTVGLPAMALIFHPTQIKDFEFTCEGLGQWDGHPAWQIHFTQRAPEQPNRILAYSVDNKTYSVPLKGRAWIDLGTYHIRRLEVELVKPIPAIRLMQQYLAIDYGPVQFRTHKQQLWLPLDVELYSERQGRRFYRRHTFDDFKLFEVESAEQIHDPQQSYCFRNTSDRDVVGMLSVSSVSGNPRKVVSIQFTMLPGRNVCKLVGPGKDVNMPADEVASATFMHTGPTGAVTVDGNLVKDTALEIVPEANFATNNP